MSETNGGGRRSTNGLYANLVVCGPSVMTDMLSLSWSVSLSKEDDVLHGNWRTLGSFPLEACTNISHLVEWLMLE
jgi:hypothetical protein